VGLPGCDSRRGFVGTQVDGTQSSHFTAAVTERSGAVFTELT